jgi:hypothetical protein
VPMPRRAAGYASTGRTQHRAPVRPAEVKGFGCRPIAAIRARSKDRLRKARQEEGSESGSDSYRSQSVLLHIARVPQAV